MRRSIPWLGLAIIVFLGNGQVRAAEDALTDLNRLAQNASCLIDAQSVVKLASQSQGVLDHVYVRRGDLVKKGDVVAKLESSVEEALLNAARIKAQSDAAIRSKQAELSGAEKKLARQRTLASNQVASQQVLETAETDVEVLRAQLGQVKVDNQLAVVDVERIAASLERRKLISPVDGIVASVDHYPGEYADSNTVVATLLEADPLRIELYLPIAAYKLVARGQTAQIRPLGPFTETLLAKVVMKDRQIDAASNLFQVQLTMDNHDFAIPSGLRCTATFVQSR